VWDNAIDHFVQMLLHILQDTPDDHVKAPGNDSPARPIRATPTDKPNHPDE